MVKKKVRKVKRKRRGVVRRVKRVRGVKKSPEQVKRDLEFFEKGVGRLKELERELKRLDTRGFYNEERVIRLKLKNVSDIPGIEKGIKILRLKINNKYKPKIRKKRSAVVEQLKKLNKKVEVMNKKPRISSSVSGAVDSEFTNFLGDVKGKLSKQSKKKEIEMRSVLRVKLKQKNTEFKQRQKELEKDFEDKKRRLEESVRKRRQSLNKKSRQKVKEEIKDKISSLKKQFKVKKKRIKVDKKSKTKKIKKVIKKIGKKNLSFKEKLAVKKEVMQIENKINKKLNKLSLRV
jgi:DNA repair exonuclease SbcCD ATPase subunit